jgi:hypothetical protein
MPDLTRTRRPRHGRTRYGHKVAQGYSQAATGLAGREGRSSSAAKLVKLADKICNLRDILASPPADWSLERKREYFDWANSVIDRVRGANARLEKRFDPLYGMRP